MQKGIKLKDITYITSTTVVNFGRQRELDTDSKAIHPVEIKNLDNKSNVTDAGDDQFLFCFFEDFRKSLKNEIKMFSINCNGREGEWR